LRPSHASVTIKATLPLKDVFWFHTVIQVNTKRQDGLAQETQG
jgi:hypothetical protein